MKVKEDAKYGSKLFVMIGKNYHQMVIPVFSAQHTQERKIIIQDVELMTVMAKGLSFPEQDNVDNVVQWYLIKKEEIVL